MESQTVVIRFKAIGSAPIMKQPFYKITASHKYSAVISFLKKELSWDPAPGSGNGTGGKGAENLVSRELLYFFMRPLFTSGLPFPF